MARRVACCAVFPELVACPSLGFIPVLQQVLGELLLLCQGLGWVQRGGE